MYHVLQLLESVVGVERVGVPLAESSYFATFADSSCHYALSAFLLALSSKIIQKVTDSSALHTGLTPTKKSYRDSCWQFGCQALNG